MTGMKICMCTLAGTEACRRCGNNMPFQPIWQEPQEYPPYVPDRRLTPEEYKQAVKWAKEAGLTNIDIQGMLF